METFSALLALCEGNSPVTGEFPSQMSVTRSFGVFCAWTNGWVNNRDASDLRRLCTHYDVTEMICLFVSLLSHFWLIHFFPPTPALSTISRPLSSSMCSITPETANVGSSYNHMRGPGIGCWFSYRSNCSHRSLTLTFTLTSENLSLYTTLRFLLSPLLLHPRLLGMFQSDIPLFKLTWPAKHSPNQGWESTHKLHLYPLGGVFYSP